MFHRLGCQAPICYACTLQQLLRLTHKANKIILTRKKEKKKMSKLGPARFNCPIVTLKMKNLLLGPSFPFDSSLNQDLQVLYSGITTQPNDVILH